VTAQFLTEFSAHVSFLGIPALCCTPKPQTQAQTSFGRATVLAATRGNLSKWNR
jgi:hypothetical protein